MIIFSKVWLSAVWLASVLPTIEASSQAPSAFDVRNATVIATLHAEGAQTYECKPDSSKSASRPHALTWQFREPIATLIVGGQSVGRHHAGPSWDYIDSSGVKGRVVASAPAATSNDIPWLEIEVVDHRNDGILSDATTGVLHTKKLHFRLLSSQSSCHKRDSYETIP